MSTVKTSSPPPPPPPPPIPPAAVRQHIAILGKTGSGKTYAAKSVVEVLLCVNGSELSRTEVAKLSGFEPGSGTFAKYCSTLRSFGVVVYPRKTTMAAAQ
jgi:hypothetical protein